jgi:putative oxidoreductase
MFKKLLLLRSIPVNCDAGLLALRLIAVTSLFLKHGLEKTIGFRQTYSFMAAIHLDPIGIGVLPTMLYAAFADGICTVLMIAGLATRWAALFSFINIAVAWAFVHHFQFFGRQADHGELIVLYLAVMIGLFLAGAGKYSVDALLAGSDSR